MERKLTAIRSARLHTLAEIVRGAFLFNIGIAFQQNFPADQHQDAEPLSHPIR